MKKILLICFGLFISLFYLEANAIEVTVEGRGVAALSGYDIGATREQEDNYMEGKAHRTQTEFMHTQQIKEASRQAEKRKKEDKRLNTAVRAAVVSTARERADKAAINVLLDKVIGVNASKNPQVLEQIDNIYSQIGTYTINKTYTGEVIDNNYIAKVSMVVDDSAFRELISRFGINLNLQSQMAYNILLVMDEFFTAPSDMHSNTLTKEVTTYDYKYDEKNKEALKATSKNSSKATAAAGYSNVYGSGGAKASSQYNSSSNLGHVVDYSKNESEFFQNIKEYAPKNPQAQNMNYTLPEVQAAFNKLNISSLDNGLFKSKYFKQPISSDQLSNSQELAKYVKYAQEEAHADFFGIGVSYITDRGINPSTGLRAADGQAFITIYSTQSGKVIASGSLTESASGNTADSARTAVAKKVGRELGEYLAPQVSDYFRNANMNGLAYTVIIKGNLLPAERVRITSSLKNVQGVQFVKQKFADNSKLEYTVNYKGDEPLSENIFLELIEVSPKFNSYDCKLNQDQIIFEPLKGTTKL